MHSARIVMAAIVVSTAALTARQATPPGGQYAVVTGRVVNEAGAAMPGVSVRLWRRLAILGQARLSEPPVTVTTDERGVYRAATLDAGSYVVGLLPMPTTQPIYAPAAQLVTLAAGEVRAGIDITLRLTPAFRVSGTLESPDGRAGLTSVQLLSTAAGPAGTTQALPAASTVANADGEFTFPAVPPGHYVLRVVKLPRLESASVSPTLWVLQDLAVEDRDVADVAVTLQPGFRISGVIQIESDTARLPGEALHALLETRDLWLASVIPEIAVVSNRTFYSHQYPAGRYRFTLPPPPGWFVKSAISNGRDIADVPFQLSEDIPDVVVTLSSRVASISGVVRTAGGVADEAATVIVFPADRRHWTEISAYPRGIRDIRAGRGGTFAATDLAPGEYFIVARPADQVDWSPADFFESLSRTATRITLAEAERRTIDLRTTFSARPRSSSSFPGSSSVSDRPCPRTSPPRSYSTCQW